MRALTVMRDRLFPRPQTPPQDPPLVTTLGGLHLTASDIGGKDLQQDACFHEALPGVKVVIVADGISAYAGSSVIATRAVAAVATALRRQLADGCGVSEELMRYLVTVAHADARAENRTLARQGDEGGTTLLIALETADYFHVAAVGDGVVAIIHGDGRVEGNALGERQLRDYVGSPSAALLPTILSYPKTDPAGHALFLGTDGIATGLASTSGDHVPAPATELRSIQFMLQGIREVFGRAAWTEPDIQAVLDAWVSGRIPTIQGKDGAKRSVTYSEDNRTVGILADAAFTQARARHDPADLP